MKLYVSYDKNDADWVSTDGKYQLIPWLEDQLLEEVEFIQDNRTFKESDYISSEAIISCIENADLIIMILSQYYVKSKFILERELPIIFHNYKNKNVKIIPIQISKLTTLSKQKLNWIFELETYPIDQTPILSHFNNPALWENAKIDILEGIEQKIIELKKGNQNRFNNNTVLFEHGLSAEDCINLAYKYEKEMEYIKAMKWYKESALRGNPVAMYNVGRYYENGLDITKDEKKAIEWYLKASEKGHTTAMICIGEIYIKANDVKQDFGKTLYWYKEAAKQGNPEAISLIGDVYNYGLGVDIDFEIALDYYMKAVAEGNIRALNNVGIMHQEGKGVAKNYDKAMDWYLKAKSKGSHTADYHINELEKILKS